MTLTFDSISSNVENRSRMALRASRSPVFAASSRALSPRENRITSTISSFGYVSILPPEELIA